ncbi:hypothetical protein [Spirosoma radiotolerans]|nr:hypothetical protein [Spirosoma radiotolerans]
MEEESQQVNQSVSSGYGNRNQSRPVVERTERFSPVQPASSVSYANPSPGIRSQRNEIPPVHIQSQAPVDTLAGQVESAISPVVSADKKVERILIFYTDGSFKEYMPSH